MTPACSRPPWHRLPVFISPDTAPAAMRQRALDLCQSCPLLQQCAADALTTGEPLTDYGTGGTVARGVIMGGVICDGSPTATAALRATAGPLAPPPRPQPHRRTVMGQPCVSCGRPLHPWTRTPETIPPGHVMHHARGYCVDCREAYKRARPTPDTGCAVTRKRVDRRRHSRATVYARYSTATRRGTVTDTLAREVIATIATDAAATACTGWKWVQAAIVAPVVSAAISAYRGD